MLIRRCARADGRRVWFFAAAVLVLMEGRLALAQTGLAAVTGTVTDPTGAVMPGVPVLARHLATGTELRAATSETGNYTISSMPVGEYEVIVEYPGLRHTGGTDCRWRCSKPCAST